MFRACRAVALAKAGSMFGSSLLHHSKMPIRLGPPLLQNASPARTSIIPTLLRQPQSIKRLLINRCRYRQAMVDLIPLNRAARSRSQNSVNRPIIVPLLSQGPLHLRGDVERRSVAIAKDRPVINVVVVVWVVAPGRIPPARIPIPITATVKRDPTVMPMPPVAIVPLTHDPRACHIKRHFVPTPFEMAPRLLVHLHVVVGDNVGLFL